ncbi:MAG: 3-methyl-2-oxobutanoate dehydrogenase subunit VorB [Chloroflexota bacterium]|nr:3-methyl-2-oxobutanoate dehydrogenase subunit VorB [Chloroflexota bacterium]
MSELTLMKGNEAIAEAAVRAGCDAYFSYPITPQTELLEYMSARMPSLGRVFLQAESEVAAINMVFGAAAAGMRVMASSSSPGVSLMQEGISYISAAELPCVLVNMQRGGPGLGNIAPAQGDYWQATRSGGHGDYRLITLAPASVQEAVDLTILAFDLAEKYRNPAMILGDGTIGQIMEPVAFPDVTAAPSDKPWALRGKGDAPRRIVKTLFLNTDELEERNRGLERKYRQVRAAEQRSVDYMMDGAQLAVVAYGTSARVSQTAVKQARALGIPVGMVRPVSLFPFPTNRMERLADQVRAILVVEMSHGQMMEDVRLATCCHRPIHLYNRLGGNVPSPEAVLAAIRELAGQGA